MTRFEYPLTRRHVADVVEIVRRIKGWTRELLDLDAESVVTVSQLACTQPGCAPVETVILVLASGGGGRKMSIHKALTEVIRDDVVACVEQRDVML